MNKAVFLDRDGVINNDEGHYYIYKQEDFKINDGITQALKLLNNAGYLIIIISNQGGIGKKIYSKKETEILHEQFISKMNSEGIPISEIYYCPHHPDFENCLCRKPFPLMIEKAIARFQINSNNSFLIGDGQRDIEAAVKAGIKGILVKKNESILPLIKGILAGL